MSDEPYPRYLIAAYDGEKFLLESWQWDLEKFSVEKDNLRRTYSAPGVRFEEHRGTPVKGDYLSKDDLAQAIAWNRKMDVALEDNRATVLRNHGERRIQLVLGIVIALLKKNMASDPKAYTCNPGMAKFMARSTIADIIQNKLGSLSPAILTPLLKQLNIKGVNGPENRIRAVKRFLYGVPIQ